MVVGAFFFVQFTIERLAAKYSCHAILPGREEKKDQLLVMEMGVPQAVRPLFCYFTDPSK